MRFKAPRTTFSRGEQPGPRDRGLLDALFEHDGPLLFEHACALGCEGIVSKRKRVALPLRPVTRLAEDQEPGGTGGHAQGYGRLGEGKVAVIARLMPTGYDLVAPIRSLLGGGLTVAGKAF